MGSNPSFVVRIRYLLAPLVCWAFGHDWDVFGMQTANTAAEEIFRSCLRCERTEAL